MPSRQSGKRTIPTSAGLFTLSAHFSVRGLGRSTDIARVKVGDFLFEPPQTKFSAIVGNPPYIRHHRIPALNKTQLKKLSLQTIGQALDGRAGLHVYFLIQALNLLGENGRLAFIMPADICEGKFAYDLWNWIIANFKLDAVVTFAPEASPFPNVDTNPIIFFIRKSKQKDKFLWVKCYESHTESLKSLIQSGFNHVPEHGLNAIPRDLSEGLTTGLSRPPVTQKMSKYVLGDFCYVLRGVATGANEFFFMTETQVNQLGIPYNYFVRAVGRTRDVPGNEITESTLDSLRARGRPTLLLSLNDQNFEAYPEQLKSYLEQGEALGLPKRPLISQRDPWYKMESRTPPAFLFAYLGRRNARFIRNTAKVIPLTGFLCVYPKTNDKEFVERVWKILSHPDTIANLAMIGKSYGDGAVKVEPRSLERLPIPDSVITEFGLPIQLRLLQPKIQYSRTLYPTRARRKRNANKTKN